MKQARYGSPSWRFIRLYIRLFAKTDKLSFRRHGHVIASMRPITDTYTLLSAIRADCVAKGEGTKVLDLICRMADKTGTTLVLMVQSHGPNFGLYMDHRLMGWYERHGFTHDWSASGSDKSPHMTREPQKRS